MAVAIPIIIILVVAVATTFVLALNRPVGYLTGFSLTVFGAACLGFLWPTGSGGFGDKISAGSLNDINDYIDTNAAPFYVPEARAYVVQYPKQDLPKAKKVYSPIT